MEWVGITRQGKERGVPLNPLLPSMGAGEAEKPVVYPVLDPGLLSRSTPFPSPA
ncbi:hypothetical protein [Desulfospira joergensenii]|uniref:hypothetical protein n=1 Tax=Desulfospira joergensenii TaxID=53329 RepID=UPI0003B31026|nr:hypothetical protein [Desulfospira joergensenii]